MVDNSRTWRIDRIAHAAVPLLIALDERDALVHVGLGGSCASLARAAARAGVQLEVERRQDTPPRRQLLEYLNGKRRSFQLDVDLHGTEFQVEAWEALRRIPYGRTWSYGEQSEVLGLPKGARAVGQANARNPVPIVVPCHRVIGQAGKLTGFGGGVDVKRWLLQLESRGQPPSWLPRQGPASPRQLGLFG